MSHCTYLFRFFIVISKTFHIYWQKELFTLCITMTSLAGDRQLTNQSNISCSIWHLHFAISEHLQYLNIVFHLQYMNNCSIWTLQYMNGHSDVIMGALLMDSESLHSKLATVQVSLMILCVGYFYWPSVKSVLLFCSSIGFRWYWFGQLSW